MERLAGGLVLCVSLTCGGCFHTLDEYFTAPKHFRFATAKVRRFDKPLERAYSTALTVLDQHDWGVRSKELSSESAMIRATKLERELVLDMTREGDSTQIRLEIDQDGNDGEAWSLLNEIDLLP